MKHLTVVTLIALSPLSLLAQGPHFGVKAGMNLSNLHDTEVNDDNARFGFAAGVMGRSNLEESFGLQAELLYSAKGNKTDYSGFFGLVDQSVDFNLNYLELPLMACFRFADRMVEVQVGGYAAYLLSANVSSSGDLGNTSDNLDEDKFNSLDAGLVGGIALNLGPAQVGLRYEYGMMKIANSDEADFLLGNAKNSNAQLYLAIGMP